MPKVISYTPSWLSRPSPGFQLFAQPQSRPNSRGAKEQGSRPHENGNINGKGYIGPTRTIATRGTEVLVVMDNEIRWSDLCMLRDDWEEQQQKSEAQQIGNRERSGTPTAEQDNFSKDNYRVLKVPVSEQIRQLKISPNGYLLAIATSHTVHVAVLPEPSHLRRGSGPIRLKFHMLGPTTHVLSQSPVASVLWHPYGVAGNCLVTVTAEAVVRVWELDRSNRLSFDIPSLAVDLIKLSVAVSREDDTTPHRIGRNRGFSTDDIGMDVASACFGGTGSSGESAWSAMTLWVAMKEGDVYALCPLLPSKWQPSSTVIPSLSTAIVSKTLLLAGEKSSELADTRHLEEQYNWISDIDGQTPILLPGMTEFSKETEVYARPAHTGPTPALQGPFQLLPGNLEEELELSDIHVIAAKINVEELMVGEDLDSEPGLLDEGGLSASIICLMTTSGRVYLSLDLEGVEGQWLPRTRPSHVMSLVENPYLIVLEASETLDPSEIDKTEWPTFSADVSSRYSFFTNNSRAVYFFSLDPWLQTLENELQGSGVGTQFRIEVLKSGPGTLRERILLFKRDQLYENDSATTACVVLQNPGLGYFLLTASYGQPQAAILDIPDSQLFRPSDLDAESFYEEEQASLLSIGPTRSAYQSPSSFWQESALTGFLDRHVPNRHQKIMKDEIRLSHATLDLMTEAHRILSQETHQLGLAAADLFRRCERLQIEFREQIKRVKETAEKIDQVLGEDADDYEDGAKKTGKDALNERLEAARERQKGLLARYDETRKKSAKLGGRNLSEKEQAWVTEIGKLKQSLLEPEDSDHGDDEESHTLQDRESQDPQKSNGNKNAQPPPQELYHRHRNARSLLSDLLSHVKNAQRPNSSDSSPEPSKDGGDGEAKVPLGLRKKNVDMVMALLDRESALVEATQARLERLSLGAVS